MSLRLDFTKPLDVWLDHPSSHTLQSQAYRHVTFAPVISHTCLWNDRPRTTRSTRLQLDFSTMSEAYERER